jgi:hypothetical protein
VRRLYLPCNVQIVHQQLDAEPATGGQEPDSDSSQAADPPRVSYYLDGAHTPESMATCAHWFASACQPAQPSGTVQRVLIFNCMQVPRSGLTPYLIDTVQQMHCAMYMPHRSMQCNLSNLSHPMSLIEQERDPVSLLTPLIQTLRQRQALPQHALFVVPDSSYVSLSKKVEQGPRDTSWQQRLVGIWQQKVAAAADGAAPAALNGSASPTTAVGSAATTASAVSNGKASALPQLLGQDTRRGVAVPSLAETVRWLHRCAREQPRRQMQVRCYRLPMSNAGMVCR